MLPLMNTRNLYKSYLDEHNSRGVCMGLCLTWLGNILKARPEEKPKGWLASWFYSSPQQTPAMKALLPSESARLIQLFERAFRKQVNYKKRYSEYRTGRKCKLTHDEIMVNYKNEHELEKETISGVPGLVYRSIPRSHFILCKGVDDLNNKDTLTGVIITFKFIHTSGKQGAHAVAAFRIAEHDTLFLEPNYGLFRADTQYPMMEINDFLERKYKNITPTKEIIISRKLNNALR